MFSLSIDNQALRKNSSVFDRFSSSVQGTAPDSPRLDSPVLMFWMQERKKNNANQQGLHTEFRNHRTHGFTTKDALLLG